MNEQVQQIAARIKELRDILDIPPAELARKINLDLATYQSYESGEQDIPIGVLYAAAAVLRVDPTELLTGEAPRMVDSYTVVRKGDGQQIQRYEGYSFKSLALNYKNRVMEPMVVTITPDDNAQLVTHGGQEFNLILEGRVKVVMKDKEFVLEAGDSIYFNPQIPHGQHALGGQAKFLTIINEF